MAFSIKSDLAKARRILRKHPKKIKFASKNSVNDLLFKAKQSEDRATVQHLDRPTPYTKRLTQVQKANTNTLTGKVFIPPKKNEYMSPHVHGGTQQARGRAFTKPVNARLNAYGNITKGSRARNVLAKPKFFSGSPKGGSNVAGVWERMGRGGRQRLRLHSVYARSISYRKRFPFHAIANKVVTRNAKRVVESNLRRELASIR